MTTTNRHDPWFYTLHDRLMPDDIQSAINAGVSKLELWEVVLEAISNGDCEDAECCAYMAVRFKSEVNKPKVIEEDDGTNPMQRIGYGRGDDE